MEIEQDFSYSKIMPPEFGWAYLRDCPKPGDPEPVGGCKIEHPHPNIRELYVILPLIFHTAALILKTDSFDNTAIGPTHEHRIIARHGGRAWPAANRTRVRPFALPCRWTRRKHRRFG